MLLPFAATLSPKLLRFASATFFEDGVLIRDLQGFLLAGGHLVNGRTISLEKKGGCA
jgi:hypothetical protein